MVEDYRLLRDAQLRAAESLARRDEINRLITFKDWLRVYQWEHKPVDHHDGVEAAAADPVVRARAAVDAVDVLDDDAPDDNWWRPSGHHDAADTADAECGGRFRVAS